MNFIGVCFGSTIIQCFHGWLEWLDNEYKQYCVKRLKGQHLNSKLPEQNDQRQL